VRIVTTLSLLLLSCWMFQDPPGPILCHAPEGFVCRGGVIIPLDRMHYDPDGRGNVDSGITDAATD